MVWIYNQFGRNHPEWVKFGDLLIIFGQALIVLQGLIHLLPYGTRIPAMFGTEIVSMFSFLIFLVLDGLALVPRKRFQNFIFFLQGIILPGALYIGGGWYIGTGLGLLGLGLVVIAAEGHTQIEKKMTTPKEFRKRLVYGLAFCVICTGVTLTGLMMGYIPPSKSNAIMYEGMEGEPNTNNTLYIAVLGAPLEGKELAYMQSELGPGSKYVKIGASLVSWYMMYLNNVTLNYTYNPLDLETQLNLSIQNNLSVIIHLNGGDWGMYLHNNDLTNASWHNASFLQWDQFNTYAPAEPGIGGLTDRMFCLSKYCPMIEYRRMNVKIAARIIKNFSIAHPDLFIGVSTDSEIHLCATSTIEAQSHGVRSVYDYNPLVIREFSEWLQTRYSSITALNKKFGLKFNSWDELDPPRVYNEGNPWWEEWTDFRIQLVKNNVDAQAQALYEEGIPQEKIYAHQILDEPNSKTARYIRCDSLETATIPHGRIGITRYGVMDAQRFKTIYEFAGFNWGIFEWNIGSITLNTYENYIYMFRSMYQYGVRVICPYAWWSGYPYDSLQMINNTAFKQAIRDFSQMVGDKPRGTHPQGFLSASNIFSSIYLGANQRFDKSPFDLFILPGVFLGLMGVITLGKSVINRKKGMDKLGKKDP